MKKTQWIILIAAVVLGYAGDGWRRFYHAPEDHPALSAEERRLILEDREAERAVECQPGPEEAVGSFRLLAYRQTWGAILARGLTDPVWYMITDWFAIYLVMRGFRLEDTVAGFWVLAAAFGLL